MRDIFTIRIYTTSNAIEYEIKTEVENLSDVIAEAIGDNNILLFDTVNDTKLLLNFFNIVAIEIINTPQS